MLIFSEINRHWVWGGDEGAGGLMKGQTILMTFNSKSWKIKDACF